jgi:hypothetical protein
LVGYVLTQPTLDEVFEADAVSLGLRCGQFGKLAVHTDLGFGHGMDGTSEQYTPTGGVQTYCVPNQPKTKPRTFRIPDDPYFPAQAKARAEGTNLTALVNEWIWAYVYDDEED